MNRGITIVIPTYHRSDRIERAVLSALAQTCPEKEVIVVDDNGSGSREADATEAALKSYIEAKTVVYLKNEKNSGGSYSRNQGLNAAHYEYITFLDDDDEIAPEKTRKQMELLEKKGDAYTGCYCGYHKILADGSFYRSAEREEGNVYYHALSRSIYLGSGSNLLVRTSSAKKIGGYDISFRRNQDLEFFARIAKAGQIAFLDEDLLTIHYEIRENARPYEQMVAIDDFYLQRFSQEIGRLSAKQQKNLKKTFALERFRYSVQRKHGWDGFCNLLTSGVGPVVLGKYIGYVARRVNRKESYGFKL